MACEVDHIPAQNVDSPTGDEVAPRVRRIGLQEHQHPASLLEVLAESCHIARSQVLARGHHYHRGGIIRDGGILDEVERPDRVTVTRKPAGSESKPMPRACVKIRQIPSRVTVEDVDGLLA